MPKRTDRASVRAPVMPDEIKGVCTHELSGNQSSFLVWDVSAKGIGIWSADRFHQGETYTLALGQPFPMVIKTETMWIEEDHNVGGHRCGMRIIEGHKLLRSLYDHYCKLLESKVNEESTGT